MLSRTFDCIQELYEKKSAYILELIEATYPDCQYVIDDYNSDFLGFLKRNKEIMYKLLDDYNNSLTEHYFINKLGAPPYVSTNDIFCLLDKCLGITQVELLYSIKRQNEFQFAGGKFKSENFRDIKDADLRYAVLERIYDHEDPKIIFQDK